MRCFINELWMFVQAGGLPEGLQRVAVLCAPGCPGSNHAHPLPGHHQPAEVLVISYLHLFGGLLLLMSAACCARMMRH